MLHIEQKLFCCTKNLACIWLHTHIQRRHLEVRTLGERICQRSSLQIMGQGHYENNQHALPISMKAVIIHWRCHVCSNAQEREWSWSCWHWLGFWKFLARQWNDKRRYHQKRFIDHCEHQLQLVHCILCEQLIFCTTVQITLNIAQLASRMIA